jgi:hypothetical protein
MPRKPKRMSPEAQVQIACVAYAEGLDIKVVGSKNGAYTSARVGAIYQAMGVRSGFPDLAVFKPGARGEPAMFVELKAPGRALRDSQVEWQTALRKEGYVCEVAKSLTAFQTLLDRYLNGTGEQFERTVVAY